MNEPEAGAFHVGVSVAVLTAGWQVAQRVPPRPGRRAGDNVAVFPSNRRDVLPSGRPRDAVRASEDAESLHLHGWTLV